MTSNWKPMSSAPKDESVLIVAYQIPEYDPDVEVVSWSAAQGLWLNTDGSGFLRPEWTTNWQALPLSPAPAEGEEPVRMRTVHDPKRLHNDYVRQLVGISRTLIEEYSEDGMFAREVEILATELGHARNRGHTAQRINGMRRLNKFAQEYDPDRAGRAPLYCNGCGSHTFVEADNDGDKCTLCEGIYLRPETSGSPGQREEPTHTRGMSVRGDVVHAVATGTRKSVCGVENLNIPKLDGHEPFDPDYGWSCRRCIRLLAALPPEPPAHTVEHIEEMRRASGFDKSADPRRTTPDWPAYFCQKCGASAYGHYDGAACGLNGCTGLFRAPEPAESPGTTGAGEPCGECGGTGQTRYLGYDGGGMTGEVVEDCSKGCPPTEGA